MLFSQSYKVIPVIKNFINKKKRVLLVHSPMSDEDESTLDNETTDEPTHYKPLGRQTHTDYAQLLKSLYGQLNSTQQCDEKLASTKINIPLPVTGRLGTKLTKWTNFEIICFKLNRTPDHVAVFISKELCTTYSLTSTNELKLRYRLGPDRACAILSQYMNTWVRCAVCKSLHTLLVKNATHRFYTIQCESCLSDNATSI